MSHPTDATGSRCTRYPRGAIRRARRSTVMEMADHRRSLRACPKSLNELRAIGYACGMTPRQPYPTDLTDKAWALIQYLVPEAKSGGRPADYPRREILHGIF